MKKKIYDKHSLAQTNTTSVRRPTANGQRKRKNRPCFIKQRQK